MFREGDAKSKRSEIRQIENTNEKEKTCPAVLTFGFWCKNVE